MPCARVIGATRTHTPASPPFVLQCSVAAASFFATYNTRTSPTHARASAAMRAALRRWTDLPSAQPEEDASSAQVAAATTPTRDADVCSRATTPPLPGAKAQPVLHFKAQSSAPRVPSLGQRLRSCTVAQHTAEWYGILNACWLQRTAGTRVIPLGLQCTIEIVEKMGACFAGRFWRRGGRSRVSQEQCRR